MPGRVVRYIWRWDVSNTYQVLYRTDTGELAPMEPYVLEADHERIVAALTSELRQTKKALDKAILPDAIAFEVDDLKKSMLTMLKSIRDHLTESGGSLMYQVDAAIKALEGD